MFSIMYTSCEESRFVLVSAPPYLFRNKWIYSTKVQNPRMQLMYVHHAFSLKIADAYYTLKQLYRVVTDGQTDRQTHNTTIVTLAPCAPSVNNILCNTLLLTTHRGSFSSSVMSRPSLMGQDWAWLSSVPSSPCQPHPLSS